MKHITFINSHIYNTDNGAITLEIVDGGLIDGVFISNVTMNNVSNPIFIKLGNRARPFTLDGKKPAAGSIRNITIKNIHATNVGFYSETHPFRDFSDSESPHIPASITGFPGHPVEDVHLENIYIQYTGMFNQKPGSLLPVPENEKNYPDTRKEMFLDSNSVNISRDGKPIN